MKLQSFLTFLFVFLLVPAAMAAPESIPGTAPSGSSSAQPSNVEFITEPPMKPGQEVDPGFYISGTPEKIMPPIDTRNNNVNFLGQDHYYSVTFRGNGQAIVTMKAVFSNLGSGKLSTLSFKLPNVNPQDITAYQVEDSYNYGYYYGANTSYYKAQTTVKGDTIEISLPQEVVENASSSVVLSYSTTAFTKKSLSGSYHFVFETAKINDKIHNLQVGISTDTNLVLKSSNGVVNYLPAMEPRKLMAMMDSSSASGAVKSTQFDAFYQQIGQGTIIKSSSNLQPNESFTVTGTYGTSTMQIYAKEIAVGTALIIGLIILALYIMSRLMRRAKTLPQGNNQFTGINFGIAIGVGFITAVILSVHTALFIFFTNTFQNNFYYQFSIIISIVSFIIAGSVYLLLLIIPPLVVGVKRGVWVGVMTAIATVIWLVIGLIAIVAVSFLLMPRTEYPLPVPMMRAPAFESAQPMGTSQSAPAKQIDLKK